MRETWLIRKKSLEKNIRSANTRTDVLLAEICRTYFEDIAYYWAWIRHVYCRLGGGTLVMELLWGGGSADLTKAAFIYRKCRRALAPLLIATYRISFPRENKMRKYFLPWMKIATSGYWRVWGVPMAGGKLGSRHWRPNLKWKIKHVDNINLLPFIVSYQFYIIWNYPI